MTEQLNIEGARESLRLVLARMPEGESPYARAIEGTWQWLDAEEQRLRARVARLEGVLRSVEWIEAMDGLIYCESCKRERTYGHMPDCELAAALRDAHE